MKKDIILTTRTAGSMS